MPKSITLGTGLPSNSVTRMLVGLRSRWMIPFWCACCTAWHTGMNSSSRWRVVSLLSSQYFVSGTPGTNSIAKKGRPASVMPAS
jgi:hypothetical protein